LQTLPRQEAQPQEERHVRLADVFFGPIGEIDEGFLEHVRRVDAPLQTAVQAQANEPPQPRPVLVPYSCRGC